MTFDPPPMGLDTVRESFKKSDLFEQERAITCAITFTHLAKKYKENQSEDDLQMGTAPILFGIFFV